MHTYIYVYVYMYDARTHTKPIAHIKNASSIHRRNVSNNFMFLL